MVVFVMTHFGWYIFISAVRQWWVWLCNMCVCAISDIEKFAGIFVLAVRRNEKPVQNEMTKMCGSPCVLRKSA